MKFDIFFVKIKIIVLLVKVKKLSITEREDPIEFYKRELFNSRIFQDSSTRQIPVHLPGRYLPGRYFSSLSRIHVRSQSRVTFASAVANAVCKLCAEQNATSSVVTLEPHVR